MRAKLSCLFCKISKIFKIQYNSMHWTVRIYDNVFWFCTLLPLRSFPCYICRFTFHKNSVGKICDFVISEFAVLLGFGLEKVLLNGLPQWTPKTTPKNSRRLNAFECLELQVMFHCKDKQNFSSESVWSRWNMMKPLLVHFADVSHILLPSGELT